VRDAILDAKSGFADVLERVGWWYGSPLFTVPFTLTTYAAGALFDADDVRDTGLMMAESIVLVALIQQPLRIIAGRARPKVGLRLSDATDHSRSTRGHMPLRVWCVLQSRQADAGCTASARGAG
jgi:hypothetical protein